MISTVQIVAAERTPVDAPDFLLRIVGHRLRATEMVGMHVVAVGRRHELDRIGRHGLLVGFPDEADGVRDQAAFWEITLRFCMWMAERRKPGANRLQLSLRYVAPKAGANTKIRILQLSVAQKTRGR